MATMIPGDIGEFETEGERTFYKFLEGVAKPLSSRLFGKDFWDLIGGGAGIWTPDTADMSRMLWPTELHRQIIQFYRIPLNCQ